MAAALAIAVCSCGNKSTQETGEIETQAQIDSARNAGREAARKIIIKEWKDSMEFQNAVLEATAGRNRYDLARKQKCSEAFDSAFISTIRTTRPDLARELRK